jgi:hypothetical protein
VRCLYDRPVPLQRFALFAVLGAAVILTGCGSSHAAAPASTTTSTPSAGVSKARIVSLTGPPSPVDCNAPTSVELHWDTKNAVSVTLTINGGAVFASYADGKHDELVPLACDGNPQHYTFTAHDKNGATVTKTITLAERATT